MKTRVASSRALFLFSFLALIICVPASMAVAQLSGDYRSAASGNWNDIATWQTYNGSTWVAASSTPTSADGAITIQSSHTVTVTVGVTVDQVTVNTGGELKINSGIALTLNDGSGIDLTINGTLSCGTGVVDGAGSFTLSSGGTLGIGSTAGISASGATGNIQAGTRNYNTGANYVYNGTATQITGAGLPATVNDLTFNNATTVSLSGPVTISGNLLISQGTFSTSASNYAVNLAGNWTNNGAFSVGTSTVTFTGAGKTIGGSASTPFAAVAIDPGASYTINTSGSCTALSFGAGATAATLTLGSSGVQFDVNGAVTINQPTAAVTNSWNINAGTANVSGLITFAGTNSTSSRVARIVTTTGILNANGGMTFIGSASATKVVDMSGGAGRINLKGALTVPANSSTLTAGTSSVFSYADNAAIQAVNFFSAGGYNHLYLNNTFDGGATLSAAITSSNVAGDLRIQTGTLDNGGFAIGLASSKTFQVADGATFRLTGTSGMATGTSLTKTFGPTSTVVYAGSAQTVSAETYGNLSTSNSGTKTAGGSVVVNGTLAVGVTSTFDASTFSHQLKGNLVNSGTFTASTSTMTLNGASGQTLSGNSTTFNNLTINNAAGIALSSNETVNATLTLTSGNVITAANVLIVGPSGSVSRTTGYVVGNLRMNFGTGDLSASLFHIGTAAAYTPVTVDLDGTGGTAGTITASTTGSAHSDIASSGLDQTKDIERYWTVAPGTAVLGGRTYKLKVEFLSGDVGGANTGNFEIRRKDGTSGVWSAPAGGAYTRTTTSTEYSNFTSFSDFSVGEPLPVHKALYVSPAGNDVTGDGTVGNPFLTIQKGVATAVTADSVIVLAGTYAGPVNVTKSIFLIGSIGGTTTIEAPVGFDASSPTAYDYALTNFTTERAIVHIGTTTPISVLMRGFTVDGKTLGPPHTANVSYSGILAEKCTVIVVSNTVKNMLPVDAGSILDSDGLQRNGRGIHVRGSGAVAVVDTNTIQETNRFHILINASDDTSNHAAVSPQAVVRKNTITGKGSYGGGQKGIWFNTGAWGTISDNTISNIDYVDAGLEPERASAIVVRYGFIDPAHRRIISNNTLTTASHVNNKGMYLQGTRDSVVGNTITGFRWGIEVHDGHATKVVRNTITGGIVGVIVECEHSVGTPDSVTIGGSVADKNTIKGQVAIAGAFAISLSYRDAIYSLEEFRSTIPVDARYNDFGVYTEAEVKARIWDRADTTGLVNGFKIDTVLYYPFHGMQVANAKAFLQGAFSAGSMLTTLKTAGLVPLAHPYGGAPWNYLGTESVASIPPGVVDWVLVGLRTGTDSASTVATRAAFIKSDGTIVDTSGTGPVVFSTVAAGNYRIVLRHRNHLSVMSANAVALDSVSTLYNFTSALGQYYGGDAISLTGGVYGLVAGNVDGNSGVGPTDLSAIRAAIGALNTYVITDIDMNGGVGPSDLALTRGNIGRICNVP